MNADGEIDDDPLHRSRVPFAPSEAWIDEFDQQCTDALLKSLRRYATWLAAIGGRQGEESRDYGEELLQDALLDISSGVLRWDPATRELSTYLADVLRLRVRRAHRSAENHGKRYEHISLDAVDPDETSSSIAEIEASLAVGALAPTPIDDASFDHAMSDRLRELRAHTANDSLATRFLDAFDASDDDDDKSPAVIMRASGLTSAEYYSTRRRLARIYVQMEQDRARSAKVG